MNSHLPAPGAAGLAAVEGGPRELSDDVVFLRALAEDYMGRGLPRVAACLLRAADLTARIEELITARRSRRSGPEPGRAEEGADMSAPCEARPLSLLTASRLRAARACQRLHYFRYIAGYRSLAERAALRFGSLIHLALEAWWAADADERLNQALRALDAAEADPFDLARARAMLIGYDARWGGEEYKVLGVEAQFRAPLVNPQTGAPSRTWELAGKIDALAQAPDGRVLIVEHKTTSEDITPGSEYWRRLRIDGQVSIYFDGALAAGWDPAGCLYDVLRKPALRPYKATPPEARKYTKDGRLYAHQRETDETPEEYFNRVAEAILADPNAFFARGEVVRLEADMDEARFDTWQLGRQLREAELAGRFFRNPDACVRFGQTCEFFGVCTGEASLDDPALFAKAENVHSELSL